MTAFSLGKYTGTLFANSDSMPHRVSLRRNRLPRKAEKALTLCQNPYLLRPALMPLLPPASTLKSPKTLRHALKVIRRLLKLSRHQFFLAHAYAAWSCPIFKSAKEATAFFRSNADGDQSELCLARALFAAKTSNRFRREGVVFIGVFLPTRSLHAWVIEGGEVADPADEIWINYQPATILL